MCSAQVQTCAVHNHSISMLLSPAGLQRIWDRSQDQATWSRHDSTDPVTLQHLRRNRICATSRYWTTGCEHPLRKAHQPQRDPCPCAVLLTSCLCLPSEHWRMGSVGCYGVFVTGVLCFLAEVCQRVSWGHSPGGILLPHEPTYNSNPLMDYLQPCKVVMLFTMCQQSVRRCGNADVFCFLPQRTSALGVVARGSAKSAKFLRS